MVKARKKILSTLLIGTLALCLGVLLMAIGVEATEKISVQIPEQDLTEYTYTGEVQTYKIEPSEYYEITNGQRTNAGAQNVVVSLKDKQNTVWSDGTTEDKTYIFTINRAFYTQKYDMSGVKFDSKEVVENGEFHSLEITGNLPEGISVSYTPNSYKEAGEYMVIASFVGVNENYTSIPTKVAVLSIRRASLSATIEGSDKESIIISSENGIRPTYENLLIGEVDLFENEAVKMHLLENESVFVSYDVKLITNKISVQPDNKVTVKLLIPKEIREGNIRILRLTDDGRIVDMEATKEDGYAVFETEILSKFIIVSGEEKTSLWIWILIAIVVLILGAGALVFVIVKIYKRESKENEEKPSAKSTIKKKNN